MKRRRSGGDFLDPDRIAASNYSGGASTRVGSGFQAELTDSHKLSSTSDRAGEKMVRFGPTPSLYSGEKNASSVLSVFGKLLVGCLGNTVIPAQNEGFYMQRQAVTELSLLIQEFLRDGTQFFQDGRVEEEVEEMIFM